MLLVSRTFHDAASRAAVAWPRFMKERSDPWSRATRVAWGEEPLPPMPPAAADLTGAMTEILRAADGPAALQVIHSDLAGNVLFADGAGLPPAVIDISPQLRSVGYADAILVADAVAWNGAPFSFVEHFVQASSRRRADVARAVIFRVATAALFPHTNPARVAREADGYRPLLTTLLRP